MLDSIDISAYPRLEVPGTRGRLLQDWLILAKRETQDLLGRPLFAERVQIGVIGRATAEAPWSHQNRTVALDTFKVTRIISVLDHTTQRLVHDRQRASFIEAAGIDARALLHAFVHSAIPTDRRHTFAVLVPERRGGQPSPERAEALAFHDAVTTAMTLQILVPWADRTGLEGLAPGIVDLAHGVGSHAGTVAMLHDLLDAVPGERLDHLRTMVAEGGGPVALQHLAASLGAGGPGGAVELARRIGAEMLVLWRRWDGGRDTGLPEVGHAAAARLLAERGQGEPGPARPPGPTRERPGSPRTL